MADLGGLWVTTVTPFGAGGEVDFEAVREHAAFLARSGATRLVPAGNTDEFSSLEPQEVVDLVRATREAAPEALVVACVGGALPTAVAITRESFTAGADGVMVHHPVHTHLGRRGLALGGHEQEDRFWQHTLRSLAARFGVDGAVETQVVCVDRRRQWRRAGNIWHSAAIRSAIYALGAPLRALSRPRRRAPG